jgi:UDP-N-acetylmuramate--alanine ligase
MRTVHFIGIGGTGMSAIAIFLLEKGYKVSGSDMNPSPYFDLVLAKGANALIGHHPELAVQADVIVRSSAIRDDDPEVLAGKEAGIPVLKRKDFLSEIAADKHTLAVAGTHGKTTTTAMLIEALAILGQDPGFILGSEIKSLGTNAHAGKGAFFVIEADEYDYMFLGLDPQISIITNIEYDHPDCFATPEIYEQAFADFLKKTKPGGIALVCNEDPGAKHLIENNTFEDLTILTYGFDETCDYTALFLDPALNSNEFILTSKRGGIPQLSGPFTPNLPGKHNALNAAAMLACLHLIGINPQAARDAVASFSGTERRWDAVYEKNGITIINDYGHHPTQLSLTLEAARQAHPESKIWAVWEPHTFSRTQRLQSDYIEALKLADHALIMQIYAARETDEGYTPQVIVEALEDGKAIYQPDQDEAAEWLFKQSNKNDVFIVFSAGKGPQLSSKLQQLFEKNTMEQNMPNLPMRKLEALFGSKLLSGELLKEYTTIKAGGPAAGLMIINTTDELRHAVSTLWALDVPFKLLGSGSNLLISDKGYPGIVLINRCNKVEVQADQDPPLVYAETGANLGTMSQMASRAGVGGLEWCNSIPGTVGGAVYGNAGAHGSDVEATLLKAQVITKDEGEQWLDANGMGYQYRSSKFKREGTTVVILSATFHGERVDPEESLKKLEEFTAKRAKTQPKGPSFGSTFKNPKGDFAGRLLEEVGMKGVISGNAQVSERHANFILNDGTATAQDIYNLIRMGQKRVKERFDVDLFTEIEILGDFDEL